MDLLDIAIVKQLAGGGGGSGTDNYNDLSNLPKINDTTLSGNKSSSALGLQSEINSDSKLASDLVDDTNQDNKFVTSTEKNTWNGKQNAIDADHKLSSDLVDDANHTNKFVTSTEKNTWNGKQNAIDADHKLSSDLVDDANKTNKFVTSTEKNTWNNKQNAIDSDHKLSSSLVSFTTAEAAALASGIDSSKVEQIGTNQTNILYSIRNGVKNIMQFNHELPSTYQGISITETAEGISVKGTATGNPYSYFHVGNITIKAGETYALIDKGRSTDYFYVDSSTAFETASPALTQTVQYLQCINSGTYKVYMRANYNVAIDRLHTPMICLKSLYDADPTYSPATLPNYDLTRLESEDRASLAEVVDSGAKNLLDLTLARIKRSNESVETPPTWNNNEATVNGVTFTVRNDMTIRVQSDGTNSNQALLYLNSMTDREAVQSTDWITGCPSGGSSSTFEIRIFNSTGQAIKSEFGDGCSLDSGWYAFAIVIRAYQTVDIIFKPMICTKAAWDISHNYVPYKFPTTLANNVLDYGSLNDINYNSFIVCKNGVNDFPSGLTPSSWGFVRTSVYDSNSALQEFTAFSANASDNGVSFVRVKQGGTWRAWKQTTNA